MYVLKIQHVLQPTMITKDTTLFLERCVSAFLLPAHLICLSPLSTNECNIRKVGQSHSICTMKEALLLVLSILMCGFGLLAGLGNAATMAFISLTPKLRQLTFGKLLFNLAVSGKFQTNDQ